MYADHFAALILFMARPRRGLTMMGHSSSEITWRVYSYLMASDEDTGRAAMAAMLARVTARVSPSCPRTAHDAR